MTNEGKIFFISGPSGVGKGTIIKVLENIPKLNLYWAKSYTTRLKRESDKSEEHYLFVDEKKFKELKKAGEILESNFYNSNWYGSSKSEIDDALKNGKNVLKEVEVNGALIYMQKYPDAISIFIKADLDDIKNRLIRRGQNSKEDIKKRLETAKEELSYEKEYHYSIINPEDHPEKAIDKIEQIIQNEIEK